MSNTNHIVARQMERNRQRLKQRLATQRRKGAETHPQFGGPAVQQTGVVAALAQTLPDSLCGSNRAVRPPFLSTARPKAA